MHSKETISNLIKESISSFKPHSTLSYAVVLYKDDMPFFGNVVINTSLEDWLKENNYQIIEIISVREASKSEKTDII